jgi:hypothetical protein
MTQYNGRTAAKSAVAVGFASDKKSLATNVWVNDSVAVNDTFYFGKLPKGAVITGGRVFSGRLASGTSAGSCSFSFTLGFDQILWSGSGTSYSVASITSAFGNFGPIDFNVATSNTPAATQRFESGFQSVLGGLLLTQGPLIAQAEGNVFATLTVSAGSGSGVSAYLNMEMDWYAGIHG